MNYVFSTMHAVLAAWCASRVVWYYPTDRRAASAFAGLCVLNFWLATANVIRVCVK